MEEKKVTSIEEYKSFLEVKEKDVTLPSGAVFKIKAVTGRDLIATSNFPIQSNKDLSAGNSVEKAKLMYENMTSTEKQKQLEFSNKLIVRGTLIPIITLDGVGDGICITDIPDDDYYALLNAITELSFAQKEIKFFRPEQVAATA